MQRELKSVVETFDSLLEYCGPNLKADFKASLLYQADSILAFFKYIIQAKQTFLSDRDTNESLYHALVQKVWGALPDEVINQSNGNKTLLMYTLAFPKTTDPKIVEYALERTLKETIDLKCDDHVNFEYYAIIVIIEQGLKECLNILLSRNLLGEVSLEAAKEVFLKTDAHKYAVKPASALLKHFSEVEVGYFLEIIDKKLGSKHRWQRVATSIRKTTTRRRRKKSVVELPPAVGSPVKAAELTPESARKPSGADAAEGPARALSEPADTLTATSN